MPIIYPSWNDLRTLIHFPSRELIYNRWKFIANQTPTFFWYSSNLFLSICSWLLISLCEATIWLICDASLTYSAFCPTMWFFLNNTKGTFSPQRYERRLPSSPSSPMRRASLIFICLRGRCAKPWGSKCRRLAAWTFGLSASIYISLYFYV